MCRQSGSPSVRGHGTAGERPPRVLGRGPADRAGLLRDRRPARPQWTVPPAGVRGGWRTVGGTGLLAETGDLRAVVRDHARLDRVGFHVRRAFLPYPEMGFGVVRGGER